MAKRKTGQETRRRSGSGTSGLLKKKPIESYDHKDKKRANNPPVGLVTPDTDPDHEKKKTYEYDPHIDPPYGIRYGSNFQPFVNKRDVKDGKDDDLSQEPEMIRAFGDTWELGRHSCLTDTRGRLPPLRDLLPETTTDS